MNPPKPEQKPFEISLHGDTRVDPYYWMNERDAEHVVSHLNSENDYCNEMLRHTEDLQNELFDEMVGRIKKTDMSVPYMLRGYWYYVRFEEGKEYPIYCRKKGSLEGEEEILIDVNVLGEGLDFIQVTGLNVSSEQNILAFGVDTTGRREYEIRFRNLDTGEFLDLTIPDTTGDVAWANDNATFFFTRKDEALRPFKIFRQSLNGGDAVEIYHETDDTFRCYVYKTKSRQFILIGSFSTNSTEFRVLAADNPGGDFKLFLPREDMHEHDIFHYKRRFFVMTNWKAKNFRLMSAWVDDLGVAGKEKWEEVIPHRDEVLLEQVEVFEEFLAVNERTNGLTEIRFISADGSAEHKLEFDDPTYSAYIGTNPEFETKILRFGYNSLTTPASVYDYNFETRERELMKQEEIVGGYDRSLLSSERIWAESHDGTRVPISLVYRKDLRVAGGNPLMLVGYGSYGHSYDPYFSVARLSLLDRGFVFAIAHIRGGEEMGRKWYEDGRMLNKKNTFLDFVACADHLIQAGYTTSEKLSIMGGSAGGLLMGAVINMRPELFKACVAAVPFVDVLTTMMDDSIPLTTGEYSEWGNPNEKEYYDYIKSYSPYDNVKAQEYPELLVTTGYTDSQVQYWEPAKWVALLRDFNQGDSRVLFHCDMSSGHSGKSGRFERYRLVAKEYAFLIDQVG